MGLQQYWKKRDFNVTQEPRGEVEVSGQQLRFFIQEHHARRLHYDFRLELQGTLKSWAVPKGPSLDPHDKRLAVEVEDHPLTYGHFEGDIPAGQYGAGHVMLWDQGTWEAIGDPVQGYQAGSLKFQLHGHKLQGKWALVRMKPRQGNREKQPNWLLIKEDDDHARHGTEAQITETRPESVSDLGNVSDQKSSNKRQSSRKHSLPAAPKTATSRMPDTYQPQLATLVAHAPDGDQWLSELKYDGYRALTRIQQGKVNMFTRNGHDWSAKWPTLVKALSAVPAESAWLDGEVVAIQDDGSISFQALQNAMRLGEKANLAYFIFDLLYLNGHELSQQPLHARKALLQSLLAEQAAVDPAQPNPLHYSDHMVGHAQEAFRHACLHGLEGIIVKQADSPYQQQRSRDWLKVKCGQRQEFVIGGYTEPAGSRELFGALLLGTYDEKGMLRYAGRVGTGFKQETLKLVAKHFASLRSEKPAFINPPRGQDARGVHWLKPRLVAEIKFAQWTDEGLVRHASFVGLRSDKPARQITQEIAQEIEQVPEKATRTASAPHAAVAGVSLSKPAKVLFTEDGFTKLDIAQHYADVETWILPYLQDRPLSIVRCPDGYQHNCFFQKHVTKGSHQHLKLVQLEADGKQPEYFIANTLPAVIELVQLGVLELHAWGSCYPDIHLADRLIFDLDPAPGVAWERVTEAALLLRGLLEELGLRSFVKTTGGKGLHVEVPIKPEHPWEVVKAFSRGVANHLETQIPDRFTANMSKKKREGRIFVDYLRNSHGATAVAPYSTRAKAGAPVATPLHWEEVGADIHAHTFNIRNIGQRLAQLESDPWQDYLKLKQRLSHKTIKLFTE